MTNVYITEVGMARFGKREESLPDLFLEAIINGNMDFKSENIDAIFVGSMNPDEFVNQGNISTVVADHLGLLKPSLRIETASSTGSAVFHAAHMAVASDHYENVLVVGGEKMTHLPTIKTTGILAKVISPLERRIGATMPALGGLVTRRYMHDFGLDRETLSLVAVKNHHNGSLNPYSHFQKEVSLEKVNESRMISDPLRLFDIAPISDGACALILSSKGGDVKVKGIGQATDTFALQHRDSLTGFHSTQVAAKKAYDMAKISPANVDVAEIHDAFTSLEIIDSEDLGFFKRGEGGRALKSGTTQMNGDLPLNTSGGHKARGHPIGASGLAQIIEIYWQLTKSAEKRQLDGVKVGLTQNIGGFANNNFVTILEACS
jgi:acetyl-CoA acetyltransferase